MNCNGEDGVMEVTPIVSIPNRDFDELQSFIPSGKVCIDQVSIPNRDFDELQ